jgi:hypothetical protein
VYGRPPISKPFRTFLNVDAGSEIAVGMSIYLLGRGELRKT